MRRVGNLWEKICSMENLETAHQMAQQDKKYYREVKMVNSNPKFYLKRIRKMLLNKTYRIESSDYDVSTIEDKGKERELWKLSYYPHRIIQWAIMLQIEGIFTKTFCNHTCASIKGRGGKHAYNLVVRYMKDKENAKYCLKLDIKKFYANVNHKVLKRLLKKKFKDKDLLELLNMIIDSFPNGVGLPIGSYLSQFLANFYLSYFDHWTKETLKIKRIVRYMDDIVIFGNDKEYLKKIFFKIKSYLKSVLKLRIKENYQIFPSGKRGVDFVGYRFFFGFVLLRKSTCKKFKERVKNINKKHDSKKMLNLSEFCSVNSYIGWLTWCDSYRLYHKYVIPIISDLVKYYELVIHKKSSKKRRENKRSKYKNKLETYRKHRLRR